MVRFSDLCRAAAFIAVIYSGICAVAAPPQSVALPVSNAIREISSMGGHVVIAADIEAIRSSVAPGQSIRIEHFPITTAQSVNLRVERFSVTTPQTRFVLGHDQQPLAIDPQSVILLRGEIEGAVGSHVFLAFSESGSHGYLSIGDGRQFGVSSRGALGDLVPPGQAAVVLAQPAGGSMPPGVPMCGSNTSNWTGRIPPPPGSPPPGTRGNPPIYGLRQIQLAVETDYEFYVLFNDLNATAAYVVALYAADSDIYIRDVNAEFTLTFVRLWDNPNDLFNDPDPLDPFLQYWEANMQSVTRDVAQFCSGRRDLPAGGVSYLGSLCSDFGYSWTGYALGYFVDPSRPDIFNRDVMVTAHELGHSCNTPHTHDLGLDTCQDQTTQPRRGTIMSYCGQTFSGGDGNDDLWFHTTCQALMEAHITSSACIAFDCNRNNISDAIDISSGTSQDVNGNGIPDECEDANHNNVLDTIDIASGTSLDRNHNGVPDESEPDCNNNGIPDDLDFLAGAPTTVFSDNFETDRGWTVTNLGATAGNWERGVPVNDPGWAYDPTSDYDGSGRCYLTQNVAGNSDVDGGATQLLSPVLNLSAGGLNIGYAYYLRLTNTDGSDRILVEGSDNNGVGPWRTLATHTTDGGMNWRTNTVTAAQIQAAGLLQTAQFRVRFTINDANPQSVVEGGIDAFFVGSTPPPPVSVDLNANNIPDECEGDCNANGQLDWAEIVADMSRDLNRNVILDSCEDCDNDGITDIVELDHSHFVWVAAAEKTTVREYFSKYGTQTQVSADAALQQPQDLIITPTRRVLVTSRTDNRVAEFALNGTFVRNLVTSGTGGLSLPTTMALAPWGNLLVVSRNTSSVLEYNIGTGAFVRAFVTAGSGGLTTPFGLAFKPGGNLFVTSGDTQVFEYDRTSGAFVRILVATAGNGGLASARGLLWNPRTGNLLVCSAGTNQVLEYNGATGAFLRQWSQVGNGSVLTLDQPWCLRVGPEGDIYCSRYNLSLLAPPGGGGGGGGGGYADDDFDNDDDYHDGLGHEELHLTNARIYHFDADNGYFVRAFIMGVNSGITNPTGFDFVPDAGTDCNYNQRPDNCDIAMGISLDVNHNGVPDECEGGGPCPGDLDGDRDVDISDLARLLAHFGTAGGATAGDGDSDSDGDVDLSDLASLLAHFGSVCP